MKQAIISALILFTADLFACSGDCAVCHPKLLHNGKYDSDHAILGKCKRCHIDGTKIIALKEPLKKGEAYKIVKSDDNKSLSHTECGADCWQCHSIDDVSAIDIQEHKVLGRCIKCHVKLDKSLFDTMPSSNNFLSNTLGSM